MLDLWVRAGALARPTDHLDGLMLRLRRDRSLFLLALAGDVVVGTLMGGWDGWRGNMYRLAVDPAYRRRGIAEGLVTGVERRLRAMGAERITALVFHQEPGAAEFWTGAGYAPDRSIQRYAKDLGPTRSLDST